MINRINKVKEDAVGLVCFDMDGTLVNCEPLEVIAKEHGVGEEVKRITNLAMNGELDFEEAVRKRVELLSGLPIEKIESIADNLPLMPGAEELILKLKRKGFVTGIITGGFDIIANKIAKRLGIDFFTANTLEIENGLLTGGFGLNVNNNKELHLENAKKEFKINHVIAVGDGANDIPMLEAADLGIAFCAKPIVKKKIRIQLKERNLLKLLGIVERNLKGLNKHNFNG